MRIDWVLVAVVVGVLVIMTTVGVLLKVSDSTSWDRTEDPDCYLRTFTNNHLFSSEPTVRVRYCAVKS